MKQQTLRVDPSGQCVLVGSGPSVPREKVHVGVRRAHTAIQPVKPARAAEDAAPWLMRFLALALGLFVLVLLVLHG